MVSLKLICLVTVIYPVDSSIHCLNNDSQMDRDNRYFTFENCILNLLVQIMVNVDPVYIEHSSIADRITPKELFLAQKTFTLPTISRYLLDI